MPPSAITVCALPSSDLQTTATRAPASCAAIAARSPAPPAPITTTSYSCCSRPVAAPESIRLPVIGCREPESGPGNAVDMSEEPQVGDGTGGEQVDVEVGERDGEQRQPGVRRVPGVEARHEAPGPVPHRVLREVPEPATHGVPAGVAGQRVQPDQRDVHEEHQRAEAHMTPAA